MGRGCPPTEVEIPSTLPSDSLLILSLGSTVNNAYSQLISSMLESAQAHVNLSDSITSQVVDSLRATERRHEDAKKKQEQYFTKLLSERDRVYSDHIKVWTGPSCCFL